MICCCNICIGNYCQLYGHLKTGRHEMDNLILSKNMHIVWWGSFFKNFTDVSNLTNSSWSLHPDINQFDTELIHDEWIENMKLRFECSNCLNVWTSMLGSVQFKLYFIDNGYILTFKIYSQKCAKCKVNEFFSGICYPEEVERAIHKCRVKILHEKSNYGQEKSRMGKPRGEHNSESCEACFDGICRYSKSQNKSDGISITSSNENHKPACAETGLTSDYESEFDDSSNSLKRSLSFTKFDKIKSCLFTRQVSTLF